MQAAQKRNNIVLKQINVLTSGSCYDFLTLNTKDLIGVRICDAFIAS